MKVTTLLELGSRTLEKIKMIPKIKRPSGKVENKKSPEVRKTQRTSLREASKKRLKP